MKDVAEIIGYNAKGEVAYQETVSIRDYHGVDHFWDDSEQIHNLGLVHSTQTP